MIPRSGSNAQSILPRPIHLWRCSSEWTLPYFWHSVTKLVLWWFYTLGILSELCSASPEVVGRGAPMGVSHFAPEYHLRWLKNEYSIIAILIGWEVLNNISHQRTHSVHLCHSYQSAVCSLGLNNHIIPHFPSNLTELTFVNLFLFVHVDHRILAQPVL